MITATRKHKRKASFINMYSKREKPMVAGERNKYPDYPRSAPNFQSNAERTKKQPQEFATSQPTRLLSAGFSNFHGTNFFVIFFSFFSLLSFGRETIK